MSIEAYNPLAPNWWEKRQHADAKQWIRVSAEVGEWLRPITRRDDLIVIVEPNSGKGAAAVFLPDSGTIEVNPDVCADGINPADIRMETETGRLANPAFSGACRHEGGHGQYTKWEIDQSPKKRQIVQAALILEEPAMEGDVVRDHPEDRVLLRSSFHKIVNGEAPIESVAQAAQLACLAHGRADAGVLDHAEIQPIIDLCKGIIGDRYDGFQQIWRDVQAIGVRDDAAVMEAHGQRWIDLLGDDAQPEGGSSDVIVFVCGQEPGEGEGDGEGNGTVQAVADAISEAAEKEAQSQVGAAKNRDAANQRKKDAQEQNKDEKAAEDTFDKEIIFIAHGYGAGSEGLSSNRNARPAEHGQANVLATALQQAQYRDRSVIIHGDVVPPGKLRSSQAVKQAAERSLGLLPSAEPWRRKVRKHVDQPPITVGIACDISGSMRWATEAVASAAWVVARAVHQNDGDSATVAYGNSVHAVVKPGEIPDKVRDFNATGGMENWTGAMRSLNGALRLDRATGVRLLVFISDGHYTGAQRDQGEKMMRRLIEAGVKVLWVGFHGDGTKHQGSDLPPEGAMYVHLKDASRMGAVIGDAMVKLLEAA